MTIIITITMFCKMSCMSSLYWGFVSYCKSNQHTDLYATIEHKQKHANTHFAPTNHTSHMKHITHPPTICHACKNSVLVHSALHTCSSNISFHPTSTSTTEPNSFFSLPFFFQVRIPEPRKFFQCGVPILFPKKTQKEKK